MSLVQAWWDANTWLRTKAWALWKATYEPCNLRDKTSNYALKNKSIIKELLNRREEIL